MGWSEGKAGTSTWVTGKPKSVANASNTSKAYSRQPSFPDTIRGFSAFKIKSDVLSRVEISGILTVLPEERERGESPGDFALLPRTSLGRVR